MTVSEEPFGTASPILAGPISTQNVGMIIQLKILQDTSITSLKILVQNWKIRYSLRAQTLLFMFWRPKDPRGVSKAEFSLVFRNVILTKIRPDMIAQISYEHHPCLIFSYSEKMEYMV